jgi:hypothetical protein
MTDTTTTTTPERRTTVAAGWRRGEVRVRYLSLILGALVLLAVATANLLHS